MPLFEHPLKSLIRYEGSFQMALGLDNVDNGINVLLADLFTSGLDHYADNRFGTALTDQDTAAVTEFFRYLCNRSLNVRVVLRFGLTLNTDVLEDLRIEYDRSCKFAHRLVLCEHDLHEL